MPSSNIFHFILKKNNNNLKNKSISKELIPSLIHISHSSWCKLHPHCDVWLWYSPTSLYTVPLFWLLLLRTPAVLERQNCLEKKLLPTRSQVSESGRPKQDSRYSTSWRNPHCRLCNKTRIMGTWRVFAALLGLLIFLPWATGRSSAGIWSVYLVTVYRSPNAISWSTAQKDPSHFFHESHCISSARFSTSLTRPTRAGPCLLTPCCPPATSRTVFEARREQL